MKKKANIENTSFKAKIKNALTTEDGELAEGKTTIFIMILATILFFGALALTHIIGGVKTLRIKKEYQTLIEKEMNDICQEYDLSEVSVRIKNITKSDGEASLDTVIDFKGDNKELSNPQNAIYTQFKKSIENACDNPLKLSGIFINGASNWLYHTTVNLNDNAIVKPQKKPSSSNGKCTICGKPATERYQGSGYCTEHYKDAIIWSMDNFDKKRGY